jgi:hypothetical protein
VPFCRSVHFGALRPVARVTLAILALLFALGVVVLHASST